MKIISLGMICGKKTVLTREDKQVSTDKNEGDGFTISIFVSLSIRHCKKKFRAFSYISFRVQGHNVVQTYLILRISDFIPTFLFGF